MIIKKEFFLIKNKLTTNSYLCNRKLEETTYIFYI